MKKAISLLILALIVFAGTARAAFMTYISDGSFAFRLDIKHLGSYVTYSKLDLYFQDVTGLNEAMVFDDIIINRIGEMFVLAPADAKFPAATAFLTNGLSDTIVVSLKTPTRTSSIDSTEPNALFGDPSGSSGIDFAGRDIEYIQLLVTDLVFIYGFDPAQGPYTNIAVQGTVSIGYGGKPPIESGFSASPTSGKAPLTVNFTDQSTGTVVAWDWEFGDGGNSNQQNPSHTYNEPGRYSVTLRVTGPEGAATETRKDYIRVSPAAKGMPWMMLLMD